MAYFDWRCPACNIDRNSSGVLFTGVKAAARHVAGKIITGDHTHRQWARNYNISYTGVYYNEINILAKEIEPFVESINKNRIVQESERIQRIIEERQAKETPKILAYKHLEEIETTLHRFIKQVLQDTFGQDESGWWVKGIPLKIRKDCADRREDSKKREELYNYTYLIHLKSIIEENRSLFSEHLRKISKNQSGQKEFINDIAKVNDIRNSTMHPSRTNISTSDISFLKIFSEKVRMFVE